MEEGIEDRVDVVEEVGEGGVGVKRGEGEIVRNDLLWGYLD